MITLKVRPGITWSNGDPSTPTMSSTTSTRWCDAAADGNSVAQRMGTLVDPATKKAAAGAIQRSTTGPSG